MADESADKPFGWRPLSDEYREELVEAGRTEDEIAEIERTSVYRPVETAVQAEFFALSILDAAARRFGPDFVHDVRTALRGRAERLEQSEEVHDTVEAPIVRRYLEEGINWDALIERASEPDHQRWTAKPE